MKMIWALLRSESVRPVIDSLEKNGIHGLTRMSLAKGEMDAAIGERVVPDATVSDEMIMIVLPDNDVAKAIIAIRTAVKASANADRGNGTDDDNNINGRIFVTYVDDFYTIRDARFRTGPTET
jgi:nitrogen regulatory protein PII